MHCFYKIKLLEIPKTVKRTLFGNHDFGIQVKTLTCSVFYCMVRRFECKETCAALHKSLALSNRSSTIESTVVLGIINIIKLL